MTKCLHPELRAVREALDWARSRRWSRKLQAGYDALDSLEEQLEVLKTAAQEVETMAFRQYVDWMHFHELAMAKPFEAESEAQDFARRVSSLLTIALGADTTIEVITSNPATDLGTSPAEESGRTEADPADSPNKAAGGWCERHGGYLGQRCATCALEVANSAPAKERQ